MGRATVVDAALAPWLEPLAPVAAVLTQLGDTWLLVGLVLAVYLLGPRAPGFAADVARTRGARLLALTLLALATTVALKGALAAPRPPGAPVAVAGPDWWREAYRLLAGGTGHAFPSGHALGSTAVWGGLAAYADWRTRRERALVAGSVVSLVCLTRLALGVHYVVDVLAGVAVGLVLLGLVVRATPGPAWGFGLAAAVALVGTTVTAEPLEAWALLGAAVGALGAWTLVAERLRAPPAAPAWQLLSTGALLGIAGGLASLFVDAALALGGVALVVTAALVALPLAVERANKSGGRDA